MFFVDQKTLFEFCTHCALWLSF